MGYMYNKRTGDSNVDMFSQLDRIEAMLVQLTTKKKVKPRSSQVKYPPEFENVWAEYPKRVGANPKKKALSAWFARGDAATFTTGDPFEEENTEKFRMLMGAIAYCQFCDATIEDKRYVMQACRFFGPDKFYEESWEIPISSKIPKDDEKLLEYARKNGLSEPNVGESWKSYRARLESE